MGLDAHFRYVICYDQPACRLAYDLINTDARRLLFQYECARGDFQVGQIDHYAPNAPGTCQGQRAPRQQLRRAVAAARLSQGVA